MYSVVPGDLSRLWVGASGALWMAKAEVGVGSGGLGIIRAVSALAVLLKLKWVQARVFQGAQFRGHPGRAARAEVCICARSTLASCLEPKWFGPRVFQGALHLCHHGKMAVTVTVVSTDQGCTSMCYTGAALEGWLLEGWLRLVWVRAPGPTETVGQLGCPDPASIHTLKALASSPTIWQGSVTGSFIF